MKVAYPTIYDSTDERAWSGLGFNIARCLGLGGFVVRRIGPLERRRLPLARMWQVEARLYGRHYALDRDLRVARRYASQVAKSLQSQTCDLVFSPGTVPIAYLQTPLPIVIWTDAPFAAMLEHILSSRYTVDARFGPRRISRHVHSNAQALRSLPRSGAPVAQ